MLLMKIGLEINNITIQIVDVIDIIISIVSQVMSIDISPWCLGYSSVIRSFGANWVL